MGFVGLLQNGVRGFMLDMYDFENDVWLCHSFDGMCFNFTAFVSFDIFFVRYNALYGSLEIVEDFVFYDCLCLCAMW